MQRQTYANWELYVVDDASDDGSAARLEAALRGNDSRVHFLQLAENAGEGGARQAGFMAGHNEFVATLDSDDVWLPNKLERQLRQYDTAIPIFAEVGAVLCGHCWTDDDLTPQRAIVQPPIYSRSPNVSNNMSTLLARREVLLKAGGFVPADGHQFEELRKCRHLRAACPSDRLHGS